MPNRFVSGTSALGMALGFSLTALPVAGQVMNTAAKSDLSRTPDGHPDLQGTYDLSTMTPLERWPGDPPLLTKEQAEALQRAELERRESRDAEGNPSPLPVGGDASAPKSIFEVLERNAGGPTGYYNFSGQPTAWHTTWSVDRFEHPSLSTRRTAICLLTMRLRVSGSRRRGRRQRPPLRSARLWKAQPRRPAHSTTPSSGRSASAACSDSALHRARRRYRIIGTTICIRSCRRRTRS